MTVVYLVTAETSIGYLGIYECADMRVHWCSIWYISAQSLGRPLLINPWYSGKLLIWRRTSLGVHQCLGRHYSQRRPSHSRYIHSVCLRTIPFARRVDMHGWHVATSQGRRTTVLTFDLPGPPCHHFCVFGKTLLFLLDRCHRIGHLPSTPRRRTSLVWLQKRVFERLQP